MLRTPEDPRRHSRDCTCRPCRDPDVLLFRRFNRERFDEQWAEWNLNKPAVEPPEPGLDLDQFDRDMNEATRRIGEVGRDA